MKLVSKKFLSTSESLLGRATDGENGAWREVATTYGHLIYTWGIRRGLSPHDADNMAADVIREAWKSLGNFSPQGKGSFRRWLKAILNNLLKSHFWQRRFDRPLPDAELPQREPTDDPDLLILYERVSALIQAEFSPQHCEIMWQVTHGGMSRREVAQQHRITENLVSVIKGRIRRRVQELMFNEH